MGASVGGSADGDCSPVFQGDVCAVCTCPNSAITNASVTRYQQDVTRLKTQCGPAPAIACNGCTPQRGLCINARCSVRPE